MWELISKEEQEKLRKQQLERILKEMKVEVWFNGCWHQVDKEVKDESSP